MTFTITIEKLKIYQRYKGDGDGIARVGSGAERKAFGPDLDKPWVTITSKMQDIELIKTGFVSKELKSQMIHDLKKACDDDSFKELTKGLFL